ncbi:MAG: NAD(P)-binding domain-containing protein [Pirellulales bacterium]|nr:NAD(P)-binding domain-containing protein [Pirellulales bacterium]
MFEKTIGFVGAGRIARILLGGWERAGLEFPAVVAADVDGAALQRLPRCGGRLQTLQGDNSVAAQQDVVFVAVHPPAMAKALPALAGSLRQNAVVVSLAPKVKLTKLAELAGGFNRFARAIPNAPSLVGQGFNPLAFGDELSAADRGLLRRLFEPLGAAPEVEERTLEIYAVITAMGPTYLWPQLAELVEQAKSFGLAPADALHAVGRMAAGASATLAESGLTPSEVGDLVPVRPLAECEAAFLDAYRTRLPAMMANLRS